MSDSIEKYCDLWADSETYVLVLSPADRPGPALVAEATTLAPVLIETTPEIHAEIAWRMRAAGVEVISADMYQQRSIEPRWSHRHPQHLEAAELTTAHHVRLSDGRFQRVFP